MKIYFSGSISAGRDYLNEYIEIGNVLKKLGHQILTEHILDGSLDCGGEQKDPRDIFKRDIEMLDEADVVVAEISTPSHGVGYELAYAVGKEMPILCLFDGKLTDKRISAMIEGNDSPNIKVIRYQVKDLEKEITDFLNSLHR